MNKDQLANKYEPRFNPEDSPSKNQLSRSQSAPKWLTFFENLNLEIKKNMEAQKIKQRIAGSLIF